MKKLFYLLILSLFFLACSKHISDKTIELDYSSSGKTLTLYLGQSIEVDLIENSSKGKVWAISPYEEGVIGFISSKFTPDEKIEGAGGHRIIQFRALNTGQSNLEIACYNTSQEKMKPLKIFKITINVEKD